MKHLWFVENNKQDDKNEKFCFIEIIKTEFYDTLMVYKNVINYF